MFTTGLVAAYGLRAPQGSTEEPADYGDVSPILVGQGGLPSTGGITGNAQFRAAYLENGPGGIEDNPFSLGKDHFYLRCIVAKSGVGGSSGALTKRKGNSTLSDPGWQTTVTQDGIGHYGIGMSLVDGENAYGGQADVLTLPVDNTRHLFTAERRGNVLRIFNDLQLVKTTLLKGSKSFDCDQAFCLGGWGDNVAACSDLAYKDLFIWKGKNLPPSGFQETDFNGGTPLNLLDLLAFFRASGFYTP